MTTTPQCEQFCSKPIGPNGRPPTEDFRACCPDCDRLIYWLSHDVLPSIRKYGYYAPPESGLEGELAAIVSQSGWKETLGRLIDSLDLPAPVYLEEQ